MSYEKQNDVSIEARFDPSLISIEDEEFEEVYLIVNNELVEVKAYAIFQLPSTEATRGRKFFDLDDFSQPVYISEYVQVYKGTLMVVDDKDDYEYCEDLYVQFNLHHPKDFKGHSLSVSDIVRLNDKYYYCRTVGWQQVEVKQ